MPTAVEARQLLTVDASTIVSLLIDPSGAGERTADALRGAELIAPDLMQIEVMNVLRRRRSGGLLAEHDATAAFTTLRELPITLWPPQTVAQRVWDLGDNLSSYDAFCVAIAEHTESRLVTRDARIARAPGVTCDVVVID